MSCETHAFILSGQQLNISSNELLSRM